MRDTQPRRVRSCYLGNQRGLELQKFSDLKYCSGTGQAAEVDDGVYLKENDFCSSRKVVKEKRIRATLILVPS